VKRTKSVQIISVAKIFPILLLAGSCATPDAPKSNLVNAPTVWNTPTQVSSLQPSSNGAMTRANVHGTGVYVTNGIRELIGLQWTFDSRDKRSITTPVIHESTVYFGGREGRLYAVDVATGTEKWSRKLTDSTNTSAPAVAGDTVYIGAREQFCAIDTDTGLVRWIFQPEKGSSDSPFDDPIVEDGIVYFGGWNYFHALDIETGREKWKAELSGIARSVPSVYDGTVYIGTFEPNIELSAYLHAFDSKTGQERWKFKAEGGGIGGAVAVTQGVVYVSTRDDGLLALNAKSGQQIWQYKIGSGLTTAPAVAYGTVYITNQATLYAIDAQSGKEKWRFQASGDSYSDPVIADGIVYFASNEANLGVLFGGQPTGNLHAVDAHTGQGLWNYSVQGSISRAPAVSDGTVYFGTEVGTLYALR
jgi:eukaryotic-like serine/threonine-protein kinase